MKKHIISLLLIIIFIISVVPITEADAKDVDFTIDFDANQILDHGEAYYPDVMPILVDNDVLFPIRAISELTRINVEWDGTNQTVIFDDGEIVLSIAVGSNNYFVNESERALSVQARIISDRTFVPLNPVVETYGLTKIVDDNKTIRVVTNEVDGKSVDILVDLDTNSVTDHGVVNNNASVIIRDNRLCMTMRPLFEMLDAYVTWNDESKTIIAERNGIALILTVDQTYMLYNGQRVELDVPPMIINDRIYIPVRAVAEGFSLYFDADIENNTVRIYSDDIIIPVKRHANEYLINYVKILDVTGKEEQLTIPPKSFIAEVSVTNISSTNKDNIILAAYDNAGGLKGLTYMYASIDIGKTVELGTLFNNQDKSIVSVKAYVWDSLEGITPLASSKAFQNDGDV